MPARSVCLVTLSLSEAGPRRFGGQVSVTDIYHTIPYHTKPYHTIPYHHTIPYQFRPLPYPTIPSANKCGGALCCTSTR